MKLTTKTGLMLISMALSGAAYPYAHYMPFQFSIKAGEVYELPLKSLYKDAYYSIYCKVKDSSVTDDKYGYNALEMRSDLSKDYKVDDKPYSNMTHVVAKTKMPGSTIDIFRVWQSDKISIRNLDYTDTMSFDCYANIVEG